MARVVNSAISGRTLRIYHWVMVLLAVAAAVGVSLPHVLAQPQLYQASAAIVIDQGRYGALFDGGQLAPAYREQVLPQVRRLLGGEFQRFGTQHKDISTAQQGDGRLTITATSTDPDEAQRLAGRAAFRILQHVRALHGDELMQQIINHEFALMLSGQPPEDDIGADVRTLMERDITHLSPEAQASAPQLSAADMDDLTRALEVRDDELSIVLGRPDLGADLKRDAFLDRQVLRPILLDYQRRFRTPDTTASDAYISALPQGAAAIPLHRALKLGVAALLGLLGGVLAVLLDRGVGIIAKLRELWAYRELISNLVARDLKARYKGSMLGYFWSLLNPLLMTSIFYIVFGVLLDSPITEFIVFLLVALLPWNYTAGAVAEGMNSVLSNAALVKKVYFPREILPLASVLSNLINFLLALPILFFVIGFSDANLTAAALFLPVIIVIQTIFLLGVALLLSSTTVFFRDVQHIMGIILQLWFFVTPIFYALESVAGGYATYIRWLNPMASLVDFYRDVLYGGAAFNGRMPTPGLPALDGVARTALTALLVLALGAVVFHRFSKDFGEEL